MSEQTGPPARKLISELKVCELRAELEKRGLDKAGVKATLIEKLEKALRNEGHDITTFLFNNDVHETATKENHAGDVTIAVEGSVVTELISNTEKTDADNVRTNLTDGKSNNAESETENANLASDISTANENETSAPITSQPTEVNDAEIMEVENSSSAVSNETSVIVQQKELDVANDLTEEQTPEDTQAGNDTSVIEKEKEAAASTAELTSLTNVIASPIASLPTPTTNGKDGGETNDKVASQKNPDHDLANSVLIRGISIATKAADLKTLFSKYGKVVTAKIFTMKNKLPPTCFGYITMNDAEHAHLCIQKLDRTNLKGKVISVEKASRSLLPQISKAATATASASKATSTHPAPIPIDKTVSTVVLAASTTNVSSTMSGGESPEVIIDEIRSIACKNEILKAGSAINSADDTVKTTNTFTASKIPDDAKTKKISTTTTTNTARPRIISTKTTLSTSKPSSRKFEPSSVSSASKRISTLSKTTTSANRTAKNISRRVLATSNARSYRLSATGSYVLSSRAHPTTTSASNAARHFTKTASGIRAYDSSNRGGIRPTSSAANSRSTNAPRTGVSGGYNNRGVSSAPRFTVRVPVRSNNGGIRGAPADNYDSRSSYHRDLSSRQQGYYRGAEIHHNVGGGSKMSSWERDELLLTMRRREDEYRKKEEELKLQRERERLKFEREKLEREKLEVQQLKLTAQLASAQMAFLPAANGQIANVMADFENAGGLGNSNIGSSSGGNGKSGKNASSKKHLSSGGAGGMGSRRESHASSVRGRNDNSRRSKNRTDRRSRSRSPHGGSSSIIKHGRGGTSHYNSNNRSSLSRYGSAPQNSTAKQSSINAGFGGGGNGFSSTHRSGGRGSSRDKSFSNTRFSGVGGVGDFSSYARNYDQPGGASSNNYGDRASGRGGGGGRTDASPIRNRSPIRRGAGGDRDSQGYMVGGISHHQSSRGILDDNMDVSSYAPRTDPSYATRVASGGATVSAISADEMFGVSASAGGSAFYNSGGSTQPRDSGGYISSRMTSGGGGGYRDSLPSTYQTTLNSGGGVSGHWNASGSRGGYVDSGTLLGASSSWVPTGTSDADGMWGGSAGRGEWDGSYSSSLSTAQQPGGYSNTRYGSSATGAYTSSRRY